LVFYYGLLYLEKTSKAWRRKAKREGMKFHICLRLKMHVQTSKNFADILLFLFHISFWMGRMERVGGDVEGFSAN
jgi:hypothetical protein